MMFRWFVLLVVAKCVVCQDVGDVDATHGTYIGQVGPGAHLVKGKVYIVSETQIRLVDFEYDGGGPGK